MAGEWEPTLDRCGVELGEQRIVVVQSREDESKWTTKGHLRRTAEDMRSKVSRPAPPVQSPPSEEERGDAGAQPSLLFSPRPQSPTLVPALIQVRERTKRARRREEVSGRSWMALDCGGRWLTESLVTHPEQRILPVAVCTVPSAPSYTAPDREPSYAAPPSSLPHQIL